MGSLASLNQFWFNKFLQDLDLESRDLPEKTVIKLTKEIATTAFTMIVEKTPVDYGHARANWDVGLNKVPTREFDTDFEADVSAPTKEATATALRRGKPKLARIKAYDEVNIVNNVPYMDILEYGFFDPKSPGPSGDERLHRFGRIWVRGGYSTQAPRGIIRNTLWHLKRQYK